MTNTSSMIEEFLARGGTIRQVAPGARAMRESEMRAIAHDSDWKKEQREINRQVREKERLEEEQRLILARAIVAEADAIPVPPSRMTKAQKSLWDRAKKMRPLLEEKAPAPAAKSRPAPRPAAKVSVYKGLDLSVVRAHFPSTKGWDDATLRARLAGAMTLGDAEFSLARWR